MRAPDTRNPRIGLLGMFTSHNLGDTAIVREMIEQIRLRLPGAEFIGICQDPVGAVRVHGIAAFHSSGYGAAFHADGAPWREVEHPGPKWLARGLGTRRILAVAKTLDLIVMTGGGQIDDFFGGTKSQPRTLLAWMVIARALRIPTAFFSVGVDQLISRASRILCVNAIRLANLRSFRDAGSLELLREIGFRGDWNLVPDPALGLDASRFVSKEWGGSDLIVVSPISFRTWTLTRAGYYEAYLRRLAAACEEWVMKGQRIRFVCSDIEMDPPVVSQVVDHLSTNARECAEFIDVKTVDAFVESVAGARFVVASRLHALILAMAAGIPVIAISPARKVTRLMLDSGLEEYCIEMPAMSEESLRAAAAKVEESQLQLRNHITAMTLHCRTQLAPAYDELVGLLARSDRAPE